MMLHEDEDNGDDLESLFDGFDYEEWERNRLAEEEEDFDFNFGGSTSGGDVTGYLELREGEEEERLILRKYQGEVILDCRSEVVMIFTNNTFALLFRLTNGRQIFGYGEGIGKLFRGKLTVGLTDEQIEAEAFELCRTYSVLDGKGEPVIATD